MEGRVFEMFLRKFKNFQNCKTVQNRSQIVQKCFEHVLGYLLRKFLFAQCSMEGRVFELFSKNQKNFKIAKIPKSFPKVSKSVLNMFWGTFFGNFFLPSVPWSVESSKCFQKFKNFQKSKKAQNRSEKCPNVFWTCYGVVFSKVFFAQCSMQGRDFEMFSKNQKNFKIAKIPKSFPKVSKRVLNMLWGSFFEKTFLPSVPCRVDFEMFSKNRKFFKIQKSPKSCPKVSKRVLNMFWGIFFWKFFLPSVPWRVESSKCF